MNTNEILRQHEHMQQAMVAQILVKDYYRILSDPVEHPPTIETKRRLAAMWTLFDYYLTAKEKAVLCKWWATGIDNIEGITYTGLDNVIEVNYTQDINQST